MAGILPPKLLARPTRTRRLSAAVFFGVRQDGVLRVFTPDRCRRKFIFEQEAFAVTQCGQLRSLHAVVVRYRAKEGPDERLFTGAGDDRRWGGHVKDLSIPDCDLPV